MSSQHTARTGGTERGICPHEVQLGRSSRNTTRAEGKGNLSSRNTARTIEGTCLHEIQLGQEKRRGNIVSQNQTAIVIYSDLGLLPSVKRLVYIS